MVQAGCTISQRLSSHSPPSHRQYAFSEDSVLIFTFPQQRIHCRFPLLCLEFIGSQPLRPMSCRQNVLQAYRETYTQMSRIHNNL